MTKRPSPATHPNADAFPPIGGPALRALATAGVRSLSALTRWSEPELLDLHGMGPKGVRLLKEALAARGQHLREDRKATARPRSVALPESMLTGKASSAKAADGDAPVFAYIAGLPQPQRGIAERVDALAAKTLPGLKRSVKWGMAYYGVGDGWCFCCGGFATHVKLMFINGATLVPVPPVTPVAMGKATRGVELTTASQLDERQVADWMRQVVAAPGVGRKRKR